MELKIYSPQDAGFIQKIDWNFEELKTEISAVAQEYETSVYTDDTIGDAKADRAKLRRETLFRAEAIVSEFRFDRWYDQEGFMLGLQANFQPTADLNLILKVSGNIEKKNNAAYSDDGVSQVVTMQTGVATKADALVPNPARLKPFRTFQEVPQPESNFVFRIGDDEEPTFKLVEAEGGIWRNEAIQNIKDYLATLLADMPKEIQDMITIIG